LELLRSFGFCTTLNLPLGGALAHIISCKCEHILLCRRASAQKKWEETNQQYRRLHCNHSTLLDAQRAT